MLERVDFHPNAQQEIADSFDWYESMQSGLGEEFLGSVDDCIPLIRIHPDMFPMAFTNYRKALLNRFPFAVFYRVRSEVIKIYAVFHCFKDPLRLAERLI